MSSLSHAWLVAWNFCGSGGGDTDGWDGARGCRVAGAESQAGKRVPQQDMHQLAGPHVTEAPSSAPAADASQTHRTALSSSRTRPAAKPRVWAAAGAATPAATPAASPAPPAPARAWRRQLRWLLLLLLCLRRLLHGLQSILQW